MVARAQLDSLKEEIAAAGRGRKTAVVARWARSLGVAPGTLYRLLRESGATPRCTKAQPQRRPELRAWAEQLLELTARAPDGTIPLALCLAAATTPDPITGAQLLPAEAAEVPLSTYQRIIRHELRGRDQHRRNRRLYAEIPNWAWQIDATHSMYLIVLKALEDGDYLLKLHRAKTSAAGYKNKPLPAHRQQLIYYGIWDMATGYRFITPVVARGESSLDAAAALCAAMVKRADPRDVLHGVPHHLWSDQGVLVKAAATRDLIDRLGIELVLGEPYQKERMGGIESGWRRLWESFERSLFLVAPGSGAFTMRLSQLQARLSEFLANWNNLPKRFEPGISRRDAWVRGINQAGGARLCPERPLETLAQEVRRWVDGSGVIRWDNVEYEVPELHRVWVIARRAMDGSNRVIVEDERSGKRYDCTPWQPLPYGEHLRSPVIPVEAARARAAEGGALPDPFAAQSPQESAAPNVIAGRFGPRSQPAADLPDPLEADCYASLSAAMADFYHWIGAPLSAENRALVEQQLLAQGLRKDAVRELAAALTTAIRTTGA